VRRSKCWLCCAAVLGLVLFPTIKFRAQTPAQNEVVWFVLEDFNGVLSIDPAFRIVSGKILTIPNACVEDNQEYKIFETAYLRQGQVYSVSFGGTAAGHVRLHDPAGAQASTRVEYDGAAGVNGRIKALATNGVLSGRAASSRKGPTAEERRLALDLASQRFIESGIPTKMTGTVRIENLTRISLKSSAYPVLIGSFTLASAGPVGPIHGLFFIASVHEGKLSPELAWIHIASGETDNEVLSLVDHADLFVDGGDEVVAALGFYENYRYRIYRRTGAGHWDQIFETETLGCE
jgi:hypothetical protein